MNSPKVSRPLRRVAYALLGVVLVAGAFYFGSRRTSPRIARVAPPSASQQPSADVEGEALVADQAKASATTAQSHDAPPSAAAVVPAHVFSTPMVAVGAAADKAAAPESDPGLAELMRTYVSLGGPDDIGSARAIGAYLAKHPDSPWAVSLLQEQANIEWRHGYFTDAMGALHAAWDRGKKATDLNQKRLAEAALSELLTKSSALGRKMEVRELLAEVEGREVGGLLAEKLYRAKELLWFFENRAEDNIYCGFSAANEIAGQLGQPRIYPDVHGEQEKKDFIANGLSLYELRAHSREAKGDLRILKREKVDAPLPVPSIVHWKFGHYSSITEAHDGLYRVKDFHLKFDSWVDPEAIKQESSGYLLASASAPVPTGYAEVSDAEAKTVFGRHCVHGRDDEGTGGSAGGGSSGGSGGSVGVSSGGGGGSGGSTDTGTGNMGGGGNPPQVDAKAGEGCRSRIPVTADKLSPVDAAGWALATAFLVTGAAAGGAYLAGAVLTHGLYVGVLTSAWAATPFVVSQIQKINDTGGKRIDTAIPIIEWYIETTEKLIRAGTGGRRSKQLFEPGTCSGVVNAPPMADYSFSLLNPGLQVFDTPVFYRPAYGPEISFRLEYDQRSTVIPDLAKFSNFGPRWTYRYNGYVENRGSGSPWSSVRVVFGTGDFFDYSYQAVTGYTSRYSGRGKLEFIAAASGGPGYRLTYPDGSLSEYTQPDAATPTRYLLRTIKDPAGNGVTINYDANLRIIRLVDAVGGITTVSYTPEAGDGVPGDTRRIRSITDPGGRQSKFRYDFNGRLESITDPVGIVSSFSYGSGDFLNKLTTPYGDTTFQSGNLPGINQEPGRFIEARDPAGDQERAEANDVTDFPLEESLPAPGSVVVAGQSVSFFPKLVLLRFRNTFFWNKWQMRLHPPTERTIEVKPGEREPVLLHDFSKATVYQWKALNDVISGVLESRKDPLQARVWYNYPGQSGVGEQGTGSEPSKIVRAVEGPTGATVWTMVQNEYHPVSGVLTRTIDPSGRETLYDYDASGIDLLAVKVKVNGNYRTLVSYSNYTARRPRTVTDAAGQTTAFTYNAQGQVTSVTNPKNEVTVYTYYPADEGSKRRKGRLASIDGPLPGSNDTTSFDYDNAGNLASETGPDGYRVENTFDAIGRVLRTTYPDGTFEETSYTRLDPTMRRDRLGRITTMAYNSLRQLVSLTDPANRTTTYTWCLCGALRTLVDAMGRATNWEYDTQGRPIFKQYPDGSMVRYSYQPLSGRLAKSSDAKGQVQSSSYYPDGLLAKISYANTANATADVSYTYDGNIPRLLSMSDGTGTTAYTYKDLSAGTLGAGQIASIDGPLPDDTITYNYDELGRRKGTAVNGVGETLDFDALGRIVKVVNPMGTFNSTYIGATGRLQKIDYPNGMSANFSYADLQGDMRLTDLHYKLADNSTVARFGYAYDAVGNITQWTQRLPAGNIARRWDITYDNVGQLTGVAAKNPDTAAALPTGNYSYTYDKAGNRLTETIDGATTTFAYNALNQLTGASGGNSSSQPEQTYEWDGEDRLVAILYPGTDRRSEFAYDGLGRRVMVTEKTGSSIDSQSKFVWGGFNVLEQRDAAGSAVQRRYFGSGMQTMEGGQLSPRFFARDHLGSVRSIVASGSVAATIDYGPWGSRTATGSDPSGLGFTGYRFHLPSSLVLAPDRAYSPWQGRWASRDALGSGGGANSYAYSGNKPTQITGPK